MNFVEGRDFLPGEGAFRLAFKNSREKGLPLGCGVCGLAGLW